VPLDAAGVPNTALLPAVSRPGQGARAPSSAASSGALALLSAFEVRGSETRRSGRGRSAARGDAFCRPSHFGGILIWCWAWPSRVLLLLAPIPPAAIASAIRARRVTAHSPLLRRRPSPSLLGDATRQLRPSVRACVRSRGTMCCAGDAAGPVLPRRTRDGGTGRPAAMRETRAQAERRRSGGRRVRSAWRKVGRARRPCGSRRLRRRRRRVCAAARWMCETGGEERCAMEAAALAAERPSSGAGGVCEAC
jgi:hypothetical protein